MQDHINTPPRIIARLMRDFGLSKAQLASLLHCQEQQVSRWLDGQRSPSSAAQGAIWLVDGLLRGTAPRTVLDLALWQPYNPGPEDWIKDQSGEH